MSLKTIAAALTAAAFVSTAGAASAQSAMALGGDAPLVCHAGLDGSAQSATDLTEVCNDPDGFDIYIDYPTSLAGSTLTVGAQSFQLDASGTVDVMHATGPETSQAGFSMQPTPTDTVTLTVRMAPADAVDFALAASQPTP